MNPSIKATTQKYSLTTQYRTSQYYGHHNTVTQSTTVTSILKKASLTTASKTRSKTVQFNVITDVKIIECRLQSQTKTAKKNKRKLDNSNNNRLGDSPS